MTCPHYSHAEGQCPRCLAYAPCKGDEAYRTDPDTHPPLWLYAAGPVVLAACAAGVWWAL